MCIPMFLVAALPLGLAFVCVMGCYDNYNTRDFARICGVPLFLCGFNCGWIFNVLAIPIALLVGPFLLLYTAF